MINRNIHLSLFQQFRILPLEIIKSSKIDQENSNRIGGGNIVTRIWSEQVYSYSLHIFQSYAVISRPVYPALHLLFTYSCMRKDDRVNELAVCARWSSVRQVARKSLFAHTTRDYLRGLIKSGIASLFGIITSSRWNSRLSHTTCNETLTNERTSEWSCRYDDSIIVVSFIE